MSQLRLETRATPSAQSLPPEVGAGPRTSAPVLVTEQEVVFGTAAALSVPAETTHRRRLHVRLVAAVRDMFLTTSAPTRRHELSPGFRTVLESALMSREMDRL